MSKAAKLSPAEVEAARERRIEAMHMQEIEGNPLTPDEVAMFEREAWSHERRRAYILAQVRNQAAE